MTPDPQKCLSESRRVLKDDGVLVCSSWEGSEWIDLMALILQVKPGMRIPELPQAWRSAQGIEGELRNAGFKDIESHQVQTTMKYEKLAPMVDFLATKMPHMVAMTEGFSSEEIAKLKALMFEEGKKMCPEEPGMLKGTALVSQSDKSQASPRIGSTFCPFGPG